MKSHSNANLLNFSQFLVCHRKNGRCRGHQTGHGIHGNGTGKKFSIIEPQIRINFSSLINELIDGVH